MDWKIFEGYFFFMFMWTKIKSHKKSKELISDMYLQDVGVL